MRKEDVLHTAEKLINGDRRDEYGTVQESFGNIAKLWSVVLGIEVRPYQVALCMAMVKAARLKQTAAHEDSWIDGAAYFALGGELATTKRVIEGTEQCVKCGGLFRLDEMWALRDGRNCCTPCQVGLVREHPVTKKEGV
jgi:hypothetical protein